MPDVRRGSAERDPLARKAAAVLERALLRPCPEHAALRLGARRDRLDDKMRLTLIGVARRWRDLAQEVERYEAEGATRVGSGQDEQRRRAAIVSSRPRRPRLLGP